MTRKKSDDQHRVAGTTRPDRQRQTPTETTGLGEPPDHLSDLAPLWTELAASVPAGVCAPSDRGAFELVVRLTARVRAGKFNASEAAQLRLLLEAFAGTPAARRGLDLKPPTPPAAPSRTYFKDE